MARNAASRAVKRTKTLKISESYSPIGWESLNKIEKVSGQMMQEDFPNTASNYKIFKDSNGKEYYSCIDHRNKSNGMIVDSNFNFIDYDSAKSYDCYVVKDYNLALFLMEK